MKNSYYQKIPDFMKSHNAMMVMCCLAMVGAFFLVSGGAVGSGLFSLLLPLAACLGMHTLMHKVTGKKCHEPKKTEIEPARINQSEVSKKL